MAYNGWTNYETWNVALWLDNEGGDYWQEQAEEIYKHAKPSYQSETQREAATRELADALESSHEEALAEINIPNGPFADILNSAMSEVDWHEIAEHYISEVSDSEEVA